MQIILSGQWPQGRLLRVWTNNYRQSSDDLYWINLKNVWNKWSHVGIRQLCPTSKIDSKNLQLTPSASIIIADVQYNMFLIQSMLLIQSECFIVQNSIL